jgi:nucleotide-binding universal stress UspA family protein
MFKHLLVPLDGSSLAEAALPAAARLAVILGARVTLVHVIERDAPQEIHGERHLTNPDEARGYLDETAIRAFPAGIQVEKHVHTSEVSNVAQSIVEHVGELGPDLIVMCTHGRGGLRRWVFGRIAQQVVNRGTTPVLLIQPTATETAPLFDCRRLMVTLDGNPEHEEGMEVAAALAKACGAELYLLMVVHTFGTLPGEQAASAKMLPGATYALLDMAEQDAEEYLRRCVTHLEATGLAVSARVSRGEPAATIVTAGEKANVDMIVLATHGKTGMEAFWSGSATPNVTSRTSIPLLLVPVKEKREKE